MARSQALARSDVAINGSLYASPSCRGLWLDLDREYDGSMDGCSAIACRQEGHRRFCRRSQLWNTASQRRQVVGPAYDVSFVGFTLRRGSSRLMVILSDVWLIGTGHRSTLTPYRPRPLKTEGQTVCQINDSHSHGPLPDTPPLLIGCFTRTATRCRRPARCDWRVSSQSWCMTGCWPGGRVPADDPGVPPPRGRRGQMHIPRDDRRPAPAGLSSHRSQPHESLRNVRRGPGNISDAAQPVQEHVGSAAG